jgi:AcrR family transcriptional regulator
LYDEDLRELLISEAAKLLAAGGVDHLSLRHLASNANTSTNAIYTLFGGKDPLVQEAIERALASLTGAQAQPSPERPTPDAVKALARSYRAWAKENPALYQTIFTRVPLGTGARDVRVEPHGSDAMRPLRDLVERLVRAGVFRRDDAATVTASIWASMHGYVAFEMGSGDAGDDLFEAHLDAIVRAWLA